MFSGATAFLGNWTNCGFNDDNATMCTGTYSTSTGTYNGPPDAWQRNSCDAAVAPGNGTMGTCTAFLLRNETCVPTCDANFAVARNASCDANGTLTLATCRTFCDASVAPTNGAVGNCTATLINDTFCQPTCDDGYAVLGVSRCVNDTLQSATCAKTSCEFTVPENGAIGNCPSGVLSAGQECQPTCNTGYVPSGKTKCGNQFGSNPFGDDAFADYFNYFFGGGYEEFDFGFEFDAEYGYDFGDFGDFEFPYDSNEYLDFSDVFSDYFGHDGSFDFGGFDGSLSVLTPTECVLPPPPAATTDAPLAENEASSHCVSLRSRFAVRLVTFAAVVGTLLI